MRQHIEEVHDPKLCSDIKKHRTELPKKVADIEALVGKGQEPARRVEVRKKLIETNDRDPNGLERILGVSNLCSINFLARGLEASKAVCRIRVRREDGAGEWYGTGFLVAPGLLLTNHHVLASEDQAALAIAEFNYQHDLNGVEAPAAGI